MGAVREIIGATPLVFTLVSNAVRAGWARSFDRPGGNITGRSNFAADFAAELEPKRLRLLRELVPAKRIGVLENPMGRIPFPTGRSTLQPNRIELVINLKTAKALGITIPQSILLRADRAIERHSHSIARFTKKGQRRTL